MDPSSRVISRVNERLRQRVLIAEISARHFIVNRHEGVCRGENKKQLSYDAFHRRQLWLVLSACGLSYAARGAEKYLSLDGEWQIGIQQIYTSFSELAKYWARRRI